jgi:ABC-type sugar transport system permease subunit
MRLDHPNVLYRLRQFFMKFINPVLRCPYVLIAPAVLLAITFSIIPTLMSIRNSFYKVDYVFHVDTFVD